MKKNSSVRPRVSAGLLMFCKRSGHLEVFLTHPGGPFFSNKDQGHWSIPKGLVHPGEDLLQAAIREFQEEVGIQPQGPFIPLGTITQKSGKIVHAWGFAGTFDGTQPLHCNTFSLEWPPESGQVQEFPEIDRVGFFPVLKAQEKLLEAQHPLLLRLIEKLELPSPA